MKQLLIILSSFLITSVIHGQKMAIKVIYTHGTVDKRITKTSEYRLLKDIEYKLLATSNESRFELIKKMESDAQRANYRFIIMEGGTSVYYRNLLLEENLTYNETLGMPIIIKYEMNTQKWILTKETKKIGKYTCYKAVYNRPALYDESLTSKIVVWYTPQIPLPFGPVGYGGLPGLILESRHAGTIITAKEIEIVKDGDIIIVKPEGKYYTEKEFEEFMIKTTGFDLRKELAEKQKKELNSTKK